MKPRILHITPWFPTPKDQTKGIFIARHIAALKPHAENHILHLRFGAKKLIERITDYNGVPLRRYTLKPFSNRWRLKEIAASTAISKYLKKNQAHFDVVNFAVAYPNAISINRLRARFPSLIFTITEHWSAYHENFNLPETSRGRKRIASIFAEHPPLAVVSEALGVDIQRFANQPKLHFFVVPNGVDTSLFNYTEKTPSENFIFTSINHWSAVKNPLVLLEAFALLQHKHPNTQLILGGEGELIGPMRAKVKQLNLERSVQLTGRLTPQQVAQLLHQSHGYCQASNYETFSAICLEALACGTPVIAAKVGGMLDFINDSNGILVDELTPQKWCDALCEHIQNYRAYNRAEFAQNVAENYNETAIGLRYASFFNRLIDQHEG